MNVSWSAPVSGSTLAECKAAADKAFVAFIGASKISPIRRTMDVSPELEETDGAGSQLRVLRYSGTAYAWFTPVNQRISGYYEK